MGIRKKIFYITAAFMLGILLISYGVIYLYFYHAMREETTVRQQAGVELNRRIADNFVQSVYQTVVLLVSDKALGGYLNSPCADPLDTIQAREAVKTQFSHYAALRVIDGTYYTRSTLFVSDTVPLSKSLDEYTLDNNPYASSSTVFSNAAVKDQEWYKRTMEQKTYVFINQLTDEFCIATKIINSYYTGPPDPNGTAVMVVSITKNQLKNIFSSMHVTEGSGYAVLNREGEMLYCGTDNRQIYEEAWQKTGPDGEKTTTLRLSDDDYLVSNREAKYGIKLLFITPNRDIVDSIRPLLITCSLIFVGIAMSVLLTVYILTGRLSRPLVRLSDEVSKVHDTRNYDKSKLHVSEDKELVTLENSFGQLIDNVNSLNEDIWRQYEREKRSELRALQAQINPHFIFNAMDMVNWLALSRNCDDIANVVSSIADMMRYSITDANGMVPISLEIANIREYLSVYQLRHSNMLELDTRIDTESIRIPKFTLQPLVENSIRHARPEGDAPVFITVHAWRESSMALIEVHDNGKGCSAEELNLHMRYEKTDLQVSSGFGIRNVNERIGLWYRGGSRLIYRNELDGTLTARIILDNTQYKEHPNGESFPTG